MKFKINGVQEILLSFKIKQQLIGVKSQLLTTNLKLYIVLFAIIVFHLLQKNTKLYPTK